MRNKIWCQHFLKPFFRLFFHICARVEVKGLENIPSEGGCILFSNHISWFDPEIVGAFISEPIHYMTMEVLFKFRPLGFLLRKVGAFPVRRQSVDRRGIEEAIDILVRGGVILIFPEGGIGRIPKGEKLRPGISFIAQCAGVPLVPVGLSGCRDIYKPLNIILRRATITLRIGAPFHVPASSTLPAKKVRAQSMERIKREMIELAGDELRAVSP